MQTKAHNLGWLGNHSRLAIKVYVILFFAIPFTLSAEPVLPVLTSDTTLATAGYYQLSWQPGVQGASHKNISFELQQATSADFIQAEVIYRGQDMARVVSGMPDGDYYYRLRSILDSDAAEYWSPILHIQVSHHSLHKALGFFIAGALVFLLTMFFIVERSRTLNKS